MDEARFARLENVLDAVHQTVIHIEQDHGAKLEALFEGYDLNNQRLDRVDQRLDRVDQRLDRVDQRLVRVDQRLDRVEIDIRDIKRTMSLLTSIAKDHESRLQNVENS